MFLKTQGIKLKKHSVTLKESINKIHKGKLALCNTTQNVLLMLYS